MRKPLSVVLCWTLFPQNHHLQGQNGRSWAGETDQSLFGTRRRPSVNQRHCRYYRSWVVRSNFGHSRPMWKVRCMATRWRKCQSNDENQHFKILTLFQAAWGGGVFISRQYRQLAAGTERLDPYLPYPIAWQIQECYFAFHDRTHDITRFFHRFAHQDRYKEFKFRFWAPCGCALLPLSWPPS